MARGATKGRLHPILLALSQVLKLQDFQCLSDVPRCQWSILRICPNTRCNRQSDHKDSKHVCSMHVYGEGLRKTSGKILSDLLPLFPDECNQAAKISLSSPVAM